MAGEQVGSIWYEVTADTSKLVNSTQAADRSLDGLNKSFGKTDKAANDANFKLKETAKAVQNLGSRSSTASIALDAMSRILVGLFSIKTAAALVQMAEGYNEMAERVRMATASTSEFNLVQQRLLDTANGTYRALAEAQEVYIRTADSLRSMGYTTEQVLDITDSLSYLFVTNAASADRASTAISAYSKAINKGRVESDAWESILAATPSIIEDIANASGASAAKVRELGASGKLTAQQLNEGLRQSLEKNKAAADGMAVTVKDSFTALRNSLSTYIGETNRATGATGALSGAVVAFADAIRDASVDDLVRDIDTLMVTAQAVSEELASWLEPFKMSIGDAADFLPESFAESVQNTAREIDGLTLVFTGTVGAIGGMWEALANNIPAYFSNAYNAALTSAAGFVNDLAAIINKPLQALGASGIGEVSFGAEGQKEIVSITEAARKGWDAAAQSAGAYDRVTRGVGDKAIWRSVAGWEDEYTGAATRSAVATEHKSSASQKLTAAQRKEIRAHEENKRVLDEMAAALMQAGLEGEELAVAKAKSRLNVFATPEEIANVEALARALYQIAEQQRVRSFLPEVAEQENYEEKLAAYQEFLDNKTISDQEYLALKTAAETDHEAAMAALAEQRFIKQSSWNALMIDGINAFGSAASTAITGLLTGTMSAEKAAKALGTAVLNSVVDSVVQIGIAALKNFIIGKASLAATTIASVASAKVIAAAWAPAAAMVSLASFGANSKPASAGIIATAAVAQGVAIGGGKQYGGPVDPSGLYRINETGAPEILNLANGRQYMLPNSRGEVVSNRDATRQAAGSAVGGGSQPTIINLGGIHISTSWPPSDREVRVLVTKINDALDDGMKLR